MSTAALHRWNLTPKQAMALQSELRERVVRVDRLGEVRRVAGIDVGHEDDKRAARAAVAVLTFPGLELEAYAIARQPVRFPYMPGLLSFREAPVVLKAFERLRSAPDLILYDGQGIAHPRRFGIASHVGLLLDIAVIGVAKNRLIGEHAKLPPAKGRWVPLTDADEIIGAMLRTRAGVKPVYVSVGHRAASRPRCATCSRVAPATGCPRPRAGRIGWRPARTLATRCPRQANQALGSASRVALRSTWLRRLALLGWHMLRRS